MPEQAGQGLLTGQELTHAASRATRLWICLGLLAALGTGALVRTLFFMDMEYKGDEHWTFTRTQTLGQEEKWSWLGMPTSVTVLNPGASVWVFQGLAYLSGSDSPEALGLACMLLNCLALVLLAVFALTCVPAGQREPWLWAVALAAVNPLHVLLQRKIWPPSILPFFLMLFLFAWWHRQRRVGAASWGLIGALVAQVHLAGLFLAAGFAVWAFVWERGNVRWRFWLLGSVLGGLTLIPWLVHVVGENGAAAAGSRSFAHLVKGLFYLRWVSDVLGVPLRPYLGQDFADLLRYPLIAGQPTYLLALAHLVLLVCAASVLVRGSRWLWRQRREWGVMWRGAGSHSAFTIGASFWSFGLIFSLTSLPIRQHYMALVFPFCFVWLARIVLASENVAILQRLRARAILVVLCCTHFAISLGHLDYIHQNRHRQISGGYGLPYASHLATGKAR